MSDSQAIAAVGARLDEYTQRGLIHGWRRSATRAGHYVIEACTGETIEVRPDEAELVCRVLESAANPGRPVGLTGISAMFGSAYDVDCLVRTAGELASGASWDSLSTHHLDLARAASRLIDVEKVADWLRGSMVDGYDDKHVNRVLGQLSDVSGVPLVCVWASHDSLGVGGDSQFYVYQYDRLYELTGNVWEWLNGDPADP